MVPRPWHRRALEAAGLVVLMLDVAAYLARNARFAWDFETFYYAASALRRGLDPYRLNSLSAVAGKEVTLPFLYPPATLALFVPFTWLPIKTAVMVWLGVKLGLLAALLTVWRNAFLREASPLLSLVVAFYGFHAALLWDLRTGNVTVLEQLLLWLAFARYVQDRRKSFAILVAVASTFKLLPIAFLGLLLVPSKRHGPSPRLMLAGLALFAVLVFLPSLLHVEWARGFLHNLPAERPNGEGNPCALGIFDMLLVGAPPSFGGVPDPAVVLWATYCAILLVSSRETLRRAWDRKDPRWWVVIGSTLFVVLSPRMMIYSYFLLAVPTLLLVRRLFGRSRDQALALTLVVAQGVTAQWIPPRISWPITEGLPPPLALALMNLSFLLVLGTWVILLRTEGPERGQRRHEGRPPGTRAHAARGRRRV